LPRSDRVIALGSTQMICRVRHAPVPPGVAMRH